MKYLKLFENWLNEADGGGVKPFDPNNPGATLVVDMKKSEIFKDAETFAKALESIINKAAAKKDEPDVPQEYKVAMFEFVEPDLIANPKNDTNRQIVEVRDIETKKTYYLYSTYFDKLNALYPFGKEDSELENIFFIIHKAGQELGITKKFKDNESWSNRKFLNISGDINKNVMIFNTVEDKWSDYKNKRGNVLIDLYFKFIDGGAGYEVAEGVRIIDLIATYSGLSGTPEISQSRPKIKGLGLDKLPGIAKVFGYEIPQNYAPGQGVEMKKKE